MKILIAFILAAISMAAVAQLPDQTFLLPEVAGTLRFGYAHGNESFWLSSCKVSRQIVDEKTSFEITDGRLSDGKIIVEVRKLKDTKGFSLKVTASGLVVGSKLFWAYGAASADTVEIDESMNNLLPERCADNVFSVEGSSFSVYYGSSRRLRILSVVTSSDENIVLCDAKVQDSPWAMFRSGKRTSSPALCAYCELMNEKPLYFAFYKQNPKADYNRFMLPKLHETGSYIIHQNSNWMESTPN